MLNKLMPFGIFSALFLLLPSAVVFAAENGNGSDNGGMGFTEIIFSILAFVILAIFVFYMFRDNAK